jgi:hypothetical protein
MQKREETEKTLSQNMSRNPHDKVPAARFPNTQRKQGENRPLIAYAATMV